MQRSGLGLSASIETLDRSIRVYNTALFFGSAQHPSPLFFPFCAPLHTPKKNIYVCSSHGLFNSNAVAILEESPVDTVFVTNSVPLPEGCKSKKIEQVSRGCWQSR